jgi:ubiquinone biosynthesis UbiH/UbiF/VisC/COQ6 family hydroxylase
MSTATPGRGAPPRGAPGRATPGRGASARDFDVVIVGGGITGSAMAALLVARKLVAPGRIAVVAARAAVEAATAAAEPVAPAGPAPAAAPAATAAVPAAGAGVAAADADWDLRVFALSRASQRVLTVAGAWPLLPPDKVFAYERMCVWESSGTPYGSGSISFDCAELDEPNLGTIVEGRALQEACQRAAGACGVVRIETGVAGFDVDASHLRLHLADGRELQCGLLIVADGSESPTRRLLGIETAGHAYDQDALVAHVRTGKPHRSTAWQRFLPTGPLAFLPLPDGRSSIVWSARRAMAARLAAMAPADFAAALEEASAGFLGSCELTTPVATFPLKLLYATEYIRTRAVLVGDAAHAVHPLAGQGLNLGLLDCAVLAEVLHDAGLGSIGDRRVLRRYERRRRPDNMLAATALDGLERLFSSDHAGLSRLRVTGLGAVERLPFIKRGFAARALGLRGDVPEFLAAETDPGPT